jgi:hydroxymethylglutaryl-CoA lyase
MANEPVKLIECPRDAWQGLPKRIPTELKIEYLRNLIASGFKHIDAVSFVSPKAVPQMADSEQVLAGLDVPSHVEIIGIVVNEKGAERAIATSRVTTIGYPCSVSPTFLQRNQNQSPEENLKALGTIKRLADAAKLDVVAYLSMAFGNPYGDRWNAEAIETAIASIADFGIKSISLADTIGIADAGLVEKVVSSAMTKAAGHEIGVHLHSLQGDAAAKILAAYDAGCRRFDSAIGGLGGCPFAQDTLVGNIPTERVIEALSRRGVDLPIKTRNVAELSARIGVEFA